MSNQQGQRCPMCGKVYTERPAVSRKDSKTNICPNCGMREAIEALAQSRRVVQESAMENLTYQEIQPEINEVCKAHPGCWHTPIAEIDCPYVDVCRAKYEGPDNGNAAFEAAVLARYKELRMNPPLTLEELEGMVGEPLYVIPTEKDPDWKPCWVICMEDYILVHSNTSESRVYLLRRNKDYGKTWLAYRQKPGVFGK